MSYTAVSVEGGLFPYDLFDRIATGDSNLPGQKGSDFQIEGTRRITDEIQSAFSAARSYWDAFQRRLERSHESRTTITREDWATRFLELLGFDDLILQRESAEIAGEKYFISHRSQAIPIHIVSIEQELDRRDNGRRSPHGLMQDYLNQSDALWGLVTNGKKLRLLRAVARLSKPTYLEFDLEGITTGNLYSEFVLLFRLLHITRFPKQGIDANECLLEKYYQQGIDDGGRVREKLRNGVEEALRILGTAFFSHSKSENLRSRFERRALTEATFYRQLLRLIYRVLFLMVAEERKLILPPHGTSAELQLIYARYYGIARLRDRADRYFTGDTNTDLWASLCQTFYIFRDEDAAKKLGLSALNGELFSRLSCQDLEGAFCTNEALLKALRELSTFKDDHEIRRRINYAGLDVEEFGSVYESLLDFHPQVALEPPHFDLVAGSERKQTGSYYTPPELVHELIENALTPVIQDRLQIPKTYEEREKALLGLRVCDPASGSGHFLLAAARRIARELGTVRSNGQEPSPEEYHRALRDVIRTCVYAVDKNPLAVDLCKVALWIEGHSAGFPLSFMDHHIKCGDSLVGVADLKVLDEGIPDEAYQPVLGDDKRAASYYKKRNQEEKKRERQLFMGEAKQVAKISDGLADDFEALGTLEERSPIEVNAKESLYNLLRSQDSDWWTLKVACDLWTAAFFMPLKQEDEFHMEGAPTAGDIRKHLETNSAYPVLLRQAVATAQEHCFFHWPIEFPDVIDRGGFDVVLGNPPWERIKLQEKEFFAARDSKVAEAPNKAAREILIKELAHSNPALAEEFEKAKHSSEAESKFLRSSGRYPLTGKGDVNTYSVFTEHSRNIVSNQGYIGIIIPTGIATDDTQKELFQDLINKHSIIRLTGFENEEFIFPGIANVVKFCALVMAGQNTVNTNPEFAFYLRRYEQLQEKERFFAVSSEDLALLNPNTLTCPVFRTKKDAYLTMSLYQRTQVMHNDKTGINPWSVSFIRMFDMATDSHLFSDIKKTGSVPLYEGKLIWHYDHRFASYDMKGVTKGKGGRGLPETPLARYEDPDYTIQPRYWVSNNEVTKRIPEFWKREWLLVFRDVTSSKLERTAVFSLIPKVGVGHKAPVALFEKELATSLVSCFLANMNSLVFDFVTRQKIGGTSLSFFILNQLPVLPPTAYSSEDINFIAPRVLELVYTANDMRPFAEDMGYCGKSFSWDTSRRALIRAELDAYFARLYGLTREDLLYILDPKEVCGQDFPGETFRVLKEKEIKQFGEYRTRRITLEIYDDMLKTLGTEEKGRTQIYPPPCAPRA